MSVSNFCAFGIFFLSARSAGSVHQIVGRISPSLSRVWPRRDETQSKVSSSGMLSGLCSRRPTCGKGTRRRWDCREIRPAPSIVASISKRSGAISALVSLMDCEPVRHSAKSITSRLRGTLSFACALVREESADRPCDNPWHRSGNRRTGSIPRTSSCLGRPPGVHATHVPRIVGLSGLDGKTNRGRLQLEKEWVEGADWSACQRKSVQTAHSVEK